MEKYGVNNIWQRRVLDLYAQIPETEKPDVDAMDLTLEKLLEIIVILSEALRENESKTQLLESQVESLSMVKEIKEIIDEAKPKETNISYI